MDFLGGVGVGIHSVHTEMYVICWERPMEEEVGEQMMPGGAFRTKLLADTRAGGGGGRAWGGRVVLQWRGAA